MLGIDPCKVCKGLFVVPTEIVEVFRSWGRLSIPVRQIKIPMHKHREGLFLVKLARIYRYWAVVIFKVFYAILSQKF